MLRSLMRATVSLVSGNVAYCNPPAPERGYDSVLRAAPCLMPIRSGSVEGTGADAGTYGRTAPYFWNARPLAHVFDLHGAATLIDSGAMAGALIDPYAKVS